LGLNRHLSNENKTKKQTGQRRKLKKCAREREEEQQIASISLPFHYSISSSAAAAVAEEKETNTTRTQVEEIEKLSIINETVNCIQRGERREMKKFTAIEITENI
jgi:hypothetical protein